MGNIWTIAKRDLKSYFTSPVAYVVAAIFLGIMGWMFFWNLSNFNAQNLQYQQYNMGKGVSIADGIVRPLFGNMNVIFLFLVPFITMRLFAEERKLHTLELLMTAPVTNWQIILGKFLSSFLLVSVILAITLVYPIILFVTGNPDPGPIVTSYIGTLFMFSSYLAVGLLCSSLTENQIIAAVLTWGILLFFWLIAWAAQNAGPVWTDVIQHLSLISHYSNFSRGIIDTTDVVFYLSFIGLGLFLTQRVLDSFRWR